MNLDGTLERLAESGDSFKDGFYILGAVFPGLRLAGCWGENRDLLLTARQREEVERLLQEEKKKRGKEGNRAGFELRGKHTRHISARRSERR